MKIAAQARALMGSRRHFSSAAFSSRFSISFSSNFSSAMLLSLFDEFPFILTSGAQ
jgi:hypothetical protein